MKLAYSRRRSVVTDAGRCLGLALFLCHATALFPAHATAGEHVSLPSGTDTCDACARLRFIEQRLDAGRVYASVWWWGWFGTYAASAVTSGLQAGSADDNANRANLIAGSVKSVLAAGGLMLWPHAARHGTAALNRDASGQDADCAEHLPKAEALLRQNAHDAKARYRWQTHALSMGITATAALIVAEGFDARRLAWTSAGISAAFSEFAIWTQPWRAAADLREYEQRFTRANAPPPTSARWVVVPLPRGIAATFRF